VDTLTANRAFIEAGARRLLEIETLDEDQLVKLWGELGKSGVKEVKNELQISVKNTPTEVKVA
jgi:hypothetical protein